MVFLQPRPEGLSFIHIFPVFSIRRSRQDGQGAISGSVVCVPRGRILFKKVKENRRRQGPLPPMVSLGTPAKSLKECFACGEESGRNRLSLSPCRRFRPGNPTSWARHAPCHWQHDCSELIASFAALDDGKLIDPRPRRDRRLFAIRGRASPGGWGLRGRNRGTARVGAVPSPQ